MLAKLIIVISAGAVVSALAPGYGVGSYALGTQAEHTIRGYGGLTSVSKQAKTIDSPYATVRKTDIRVTNDAGYPGLTYAHPGYQGYAHGYHAQPTFAHGYTPAIHGYNSPAIHGYHAPAISHGYHAPAGITYAHLGYAAPTQIGYGAPHHTSIGYAAPAHHAPLGYPSRTVALPTVAKGISHIPSSLGVAYSPATAVATSTFHGHGVHYGY